jgi:hypothetical protein
VIRKAVMREEETFLISSHHNLDAFDREKTRSSLRHYPMIEASLQRENDY